MQRQELDHLFGALADPTRRAIIAMLGDGEKSAGEVAAAFPAISRPAVAKHLRVLKDNGLVLDRAEGRQRLNRLDASAMQPAAEWIGMFEKFWDQRLLKLKKELETDK